MKAGKRLRVDAVLFDLDGTLIDSAPDLAGTLNDMRADRGMLPWPEHELRDHCGSGARGMLGVGLQCAPGHEDYLALREEFLARYAQRYLRLTRIFDVVVPMLDRLDAAAMPWGIVTNKSLALAQPICAALGLQARAGSLIGGDSTPHAKPHPAPLWAAAAQLGLDPARCVYVGDDARDVTAGSAAGMATLVAGWGYTGAGPAPAHWGATSILSAPHELLKWLELA